MDKYRNDLISEWVERARKQATNEIVLPLGMYWIERREDDQSAPLVLDFDLTGVGRKRFYDLLDSAARLALAEGGLKVHADTGNAEGVDKAAMIVRFL